MNRDTMPLDPREYKDPGTHPRIKLEMRETVQRLVQSYFASVVSSITKNFTKVKIEQLLCNRFSKGSKTSAIIVR